MKKIVTMFVMMMMVLAISCAADDATDEDKDTGLKTSTATRLAITAANTEFDAAGVGTTPPATTVTGIAFKASFLTGANTAYRTAFPAYRATIDADIKLVADGAPTVDFDAALAAGDYVITLTVQKTGEKSKTFTYTFTTA